MNSRPAKAFLVRHGAAQLYLRHAYCARRHVRPVCQANKKRSGLALLRNRCQPFSERHRAGGADGAIGEDRRIAIQMSFQDTRLRVDRESRDRCARFSDVQSHIVVRASHAPERQCLTWRGVRRVTPNPSFLVSETRFLHANRNSTSLENALGHQPACKPGSVGHRRLAQAIRDGHSSGTMFAHGLEQPTRTASLTSPCGVIA